MGPCGHCALTERLLAFVSTPIQQQLPVRLAKDEAEVKSGALARDTDPKP